MRINMRKTILCFRYPVLGIFIICNAITCSVSVWNLSIGQSIGENFYADIFITVISALALIFVFPIIFIDILRMDSLTCRVWFESVWVGVFAVVELSGAVAVSVTVPHSLCSPATVAFLRDSCSSTKVLMAFSWSCSVSLVVYFILLVSLTVAQEEKHPQIWQSNVRNFPDYSQQVLRATYPVFNQPTIVAPTPRRAVPAAMYAYRSGLSSQYDIEHFQPPSPVRKPSRPPASRPSSQSTRPPSISCPALSFYPQHMQSILMSPSLTQLPLMSEVPPTLPPCLHTATLPLNAKRRDPGFTHLPAVGNTVRPSNGFSHTRPKPTGPRSQSNSREWYRPEPLNLKYPFGDGT